MKHIIVTLAVVVLIQLTSKMSCSPTDYVISSYSNVRLQQPTLGLSVESQMPMVIMLNPNLADEPPAIVDKMESIFMKSEQIKNVKSMNIDEKEIMESINKQITPIINEEDKVVYDERDFITVGTEKPVGFTISTNTTTAQPEN